MYYLQSRYYNPECARFLNADAFVSTGQGLLGNNMFAYCGNNPVIYCDSLGYAYTLANDQFAYSSGLEGYGSGVGAAVATAAVLATADTFGQSLTTTEVLTSAQEQNELYVVYFLCELGDANKTIIYVGRVKAVNFEARMKYHKAKGREHVASIGGLDYGTCRGLEQAGMIFFHTINRNSAINNQIRGISPRNKNLYIYMSALWDYINSSTFTGMEIIPLSYLANLTEEAFLNGTI